MVQTRVFQLQEEKAELQKAWMEFAKTVIIDTMEFVAVDTCRYQIGEHSICMSLHINLKSLIKSPKKSYSFFQSYSSHV
jgi:hypothetical protein